MGCLQLLAKLIRTLRFLVSFTNFSRHLQALLGLVLLVTCGSRERPLVVGPAEEQGFLCTGMPKRVATILSNHVQEHLDTWVTSRVSEMGYLRETRGGVPKVCGFVSLSEGPATTDRR